LNENELFEKIESTALAQGPSQAAWLLVEQMRSEKRYTELFEALKMFHRVELGLPAVQINPFGDEESKPNGGDANSDVQDKLDKKLIEACSEVGIAETRELARRVDVHARSGGSRGSGSSHAGPRSNA
jgi:hypothetical protein